jgi:hypothetical protein
MTNRKPGGLRSSGPVGKRKIEMFQYENMIEIFILCVPVLRIDSMLLVGALMGHDIRHGTHYADNYIYQVGAATEKREGLN